MFPLNIESNPFLFLFNLFVISASAYFLGKGDLFLTKENLSSLPFAYICQNAQ